MRTNLTVASLLLCLLTGCTFQRVVEVPGASGRIIDALTGLPVARVSVTRQGVVKKTVVSETVVTDTDGRFLVKPVDRVRFYPTFPRVFVGPYYVTGNVEFVAAGYETRVVTNRAPYLDFRPVDLATIELRHVRD